MYESKRRGLLMTGLAIALLLVASTSLAEIFCAPPSPIPPEPPQQSPHPHCERCEHYCQRSPCYGSSGVYTTNATDLSLPTAGFPIEMSRRYESHRLADGPLGLGWQPSLTARVVRFTFLHYAPSTYRYEAHVILPSGWIIVFNESTPGVFTPPAGRQDQLVLETDGTWTYRPPRSRSRIKFNADGSIAFMEDPFGNRINYTYDANGRVQQVTDAAGSNRSLTVTWGSDGRISMITDSFSPARQVKYHYNSSDGTLTSVDDPITSSLLNQPSTRYAYVAGRFGPVLSAIRDRWSRLITELSWESSGRLKSYTEGEYNTPNPAVSTGEKYTYTYNAGAPPQEPPSTMKAHSLGSRSYSFNANGLVTDQITFDPATGLPTGTFDDFGYGTGYTYNTRGNVATMSRGSGLSDGATFTYTYDATYLDEVASVISDKPAIWPGMKYSYVPSGQPGAGALKEVRQIRKNGTAEDVIASYDYNARGQVVSSTGEVPRQFAYDSAGDLTAVYSSATGTTTYEYDSIGRMTRSIDPYGQGTTYAYDTLGRVTSVTLPKPVAGSALNFTTTYSYDNYDVASGLTFTNVTDPNGRVTKQGYDALGRLAKSIDALQNATTYAYQYNLLRSITDANGNKTTYAYDQDRQLASTTFPDGNVESYVHTRSGILTRVTDRRGIARTYTFDAFGRLTTIAYPSERVLLQWLGNQPAGGEEGIPGVLAKSFHTIAYDDSFRPQTTTILLGPGTGHTLSYTYETANPLAPLASHTLTPPSGSGEQPSTVSYWYDAGRRVVQMTASGMPGLFDYTYGADGRYQRITLPNGQRRDYIYDLQGRLTTLSNSLGFENLGDFYYEYDFNWTNSTWTALGQRTSVLANLPGAPGNGMTKYEYDAIYQLTKATYPDGNYNSWEYDPIGNRKRMTFNGVGPTYTFQRYASNPTGDSPRLAGHTYDANGNDTFGGTITWDYANRASNLFLVAQEYDIQGRRTQAGTSTFLYQGLNLIRERNSSGLRDDYVFGPGIDEPLAKRSANGTVTYFGVDGLGSVVSLVQNGAVVATNTYGPFGEGGTAQQSRFAYTGREPVSGQQNYYYYRARYYDASLGRFLSEDPYRGPTYSSEFLNQYRYGLNDPNRYTDPLGLFSVDSSCGCMGSRYQQGLRDGGNAWCRHGLNSITDVSLRRCIANSCAAGTVTCEPCGGRRNQFGGNEIGSRTEPDTRIILCVDEHGVYHGNVAQISDVLIHEFAHGCGWRHGGRRGVPDRFFNPFFR